MVTKMVKQITKCDSDSENLFRCLTMLFIMILSYYGAWLGRVFLPNCLISSKKPIFDLCAATFGLIFIGIIIYSGLCFIWKDVIENSNVFTESLSILYLTIVSMVLLTFLSEEIVVIIVMILFVTSFVYLFTGILKLAK